MDYSFLKLYDSIDESISDDLFKTSEITYYTMIQLLPNESYLQMTNYDGDLDILNTYDCYLVDGCGNELVDITGNVFTDSYVDSNGFTQSKIEYVNLGVDYGGRAVHIMFSSTSTDNKYYTRPIKITSRNSKNTYRFDYSNPTNLQGFSYESADCYQSIRLFLKFKGFSNKTEVNDYYQISTGNNISLRPLRQVAREYLTENIDSHTFLALQELLLHNIIYIDNERITNKPILQYDDRIGESNLFRSSFTANVNTNDTYTFSYQIFGGLVLSNYNPFGLYLTGYTIEALSVDANVSLILNTGTLEVYDSSATLIHTFDESDMLINNDTQLKIISTGTPVENLADDTYYVNMSAGLIEGLGVTNDAITDNTTWTFTLQAADYDSADYNNDDYFTN